MKSAWHCVQTGTIQLLVMTREHETVGQHKKSLFQVTALPLHTQCRCVVACQELCFHAQKPGIIIIMFFFYINLNSYTDQSLDLGHWQDNSLFVKVFLFLRLISIQYYEIRRGFLIATLSKFGLKIFFRPTAELRKCGYTNSGNLVTKKSENLVTKISDRWRAIRIIRWDQLHKKKKNHKQHIEKKKLTFIKFV